MMKIKIEGIELHYRNVSELNERLRNELTEVQLKRVQTATELRGLAKQERALKKFLGVHETDPKTETRRDALAPSLR